VGWRVPTLCSSDCAPRPEKRCRGIRGTRGIPRSDSSAGATRAGESQQFFGVSACVRALRGFRGKAGLSETKPGPRRHRFANRKGISLLEAVVAIAIVGITSVSALEAVGGDMRTAERARRAIVVEALADSRLEFMDLLTDRELQALPDSVGSGKFLPPLDEYSWKTTSDPVSDQAGVYAVRVTIDWPTGSYVVRTYQYRQPPVVTRR
jgi:type II secretory pathway pseudopilin PulG